VDSKDYSHTASMWIWGALTVGLIELVDAWRGVRSLGGLAISIAVILIYLLPELLSLTTASAVLFMVLFLVHGFS